MKKINRRRFVKQGLMFSGAVALSSGMSSLTAIKNFAQQDIASTRRVYIINIDGMGFEYLNSSSNGEQFTPNLSNLMKAGVSYSQCYDVLPALTASNHVAIVSSASSGKSGILGAGGYYAGMDSKNNNQTILRPFQKTDIQVETIYEVLKKDFPSAKTAVLSGKNWVADLFQGEPKNSAVDIKVCGSGYPDYIDAPKSYVLGGEAGEKEKFPRLYFKKQGDAAPEGTFSAMLGPEDAPDDNWIIDSAIKVIEKDAPIFSYILLADMDMAGHAYGNFTHTGISTIANPRAIIDQMKITDMAVGRFVDYLKKTGRYESSLLVITSDHGMSTMIEDAEIDLEIMKKNPLLLVNKIGKRSVDIRKILKDKGILMRANDGIHPYNPEGHYDTAFSEGPNIYLYNIKQDMVKTAKDILLKWSDENPDHPIWHAYDEVELRDGINDVTGLPLRLYNEKNLKSPDSIVKWPNLIVFLKKNYFGVAYNDELRAGAIVFMKKLPIPPGVDVKSIPGAHGTYSEQHVPLIMLGKGLPENKIETKKVTLLDIIPTIAKMNNWRTPKDTEGALI